MNNYNLYHKDREMPDPGIGVDLKIHSRDLLMLLIDLFCVRIYFKAPP